MSSTPAVRYDQAPQFVLNYPSCSACEIDLDHDGDSWTCPKCQTSWDSDANDGDEGDLWPEWTGYEWPEDQPVVTHEEGAIAPWIAHPFEVWMSGQYEMPYCGKCYKPRREHLEATR